VPFLGSECTIHQDYFGGAEELTALADTVAGFNGPLRDVGDREGTGSDGTRWEREVSGEGRERKGRRGAKKRRMRHGRREGRDVKGMRKLRSFSNSCMDSLISAIEPSPCLIRHAA